MGRLSFPLKIHSFIQAQRPMLALGPSDSSVVRFVRAHRCGEVCEQADVNALGDVIQSLYSDTERCKWALEGLGELKGSFSRKCFFATFENFTQVTNDHA